MENPSRYTVVFDASVLVPGFLSNFLLWLAHTELFQAKWSPDIHAEWIRNRKKRYDIDLAASEARRNVMYFKFPDSLVTDYESLIGSLAISCKDRHVLAAAIKCGANAIVTTNLDASLYELLVLVDAIRDGRARERSLAAEHLRNRLRS